jgi:hypothetical protein
MGALAPTDAIVADGGVLPACTLNSRVGIPIGVKEEDFQRNGKQWHG